MQESRELEDKIGGHGCELTLEQIETANKNLAALEIKENYYEDELDYSEQIIQDLTS